MAETTGLFRLIEGDRDQAVILVSCYYDQVNRRIKMFKIKNRKESIWDFARIKKELF